MKGVSESCKNIYRKHGMEMYFKGGTTIKDLLVHPKDKDTILQKSGVIYRYKCGSVDCEKEYMGSQAEHLQKKVQRTYEGSITHMWSLQHLVMNCLWTISA